jgi:aryl-alcohol dehydrogenase-like predicted oxidoreductase
MFEQSGAHVEHAKENFSLTSTHIDYYQLHKADFTKYAGKDKQMDEKELQKFFDKALAPEEVRILGNGEKEPEAAKEAMNKFDSGDEKHKKRLSAAEFKTMMEELTMRMDALRTRGQSDRGGAAVEAAQHPQAAANTTTEHATKPAH